MTAVARHIPSVHGMNCPGDCCNFDALQDERATGEDIYSPEWPDKPVRFHNLVKGPHSGRARGARSGGTRVMPAAPLSTGPDGRGGGSSTSTTVGASLSAGMPDGVSLAAGTSGSNLAEPATSPSSLVAGREDPGDVLTRSGGNRCGS
jgi:hypothetical protein